MTMIGEPHYPTYDQKAIINKAYSMGREQAEKMYPYPARTRKEVEQLARDQIQSDVAYYKVHGPKDKVWSAALSKAGKYGDDAYEYKEKAYTDNMDVFIRIFVPVFVGRYLDKVADLDRENRSSSARLSIREEEHSKMGTHAYKVTLTDMRYLNKPVEFIVSVADEDVKLKES